MADLPRVALILTGGTIDSVGVSRLDLAWYNENSTHLGAGELVRTVAELEDIAEVVHVPFPGFNSGVLDYAAWLHLARTVRGLLDDDACDGVVITHGTNVMEETAYFLHLTVCSAKPVVVVGAMRPSSALGTDGALNLLRAVQVAASDQARGHGVLVVLNDTVFAARDVTKSSTYRVQAMQGAELGPLGFADADGQVVFYHRHLAAPASGPRFDPAGLDGLPRVDVLVSHVGADGTFVDAAVAAGARGIVSAGFGAGRTTSAESEAYDRAVAAGVVVCQSTRVGSGRVVRSPSFIRRKLVAADNLQPWKARVLLALALSRSDDPDRIQEWFDTP